MKKKYTVTDQLVTKITGYISVGVITGLSIWGISSLIDFYNYEETNDAQVQEYVNPVISRAGGFIVSVNFEENQHVKRGDTLLIIDNQEYSLQESQTAALIAKSKAQLNVLESNIETLTKTASAKKSHISAASAKVWKQELEYERYKKLFKEESATQQQIESIEANLQVYKSDLNAATDTYDAAISKITDIRSEKVVVLAELERLQSLLDRHRLDVSYTVILAPYNGRMGRRTVEKGQMIDIGQTLAFIVNDETDKWVIANYKETQIEEMCIGDTVKITADAFPHEEFRGTIISLSPATGSSFSLLPPDNSTGNFVKIVQRIPVRIKVLGKRTDIDKLKVGMNTYVYYLKGQHNG